MNAIAKAAAKPTTKSSKGEETRAAILRAAVRHASAEGFEALTIGLLAEKTGLSKSGLFAHFGSKEELQIATIDEAMRRFTESCILPSVSQPRGLKRLTAMWDAWLNWTEQNDLFGCPLMTAISEFDDKPGPVRDAVLEHAHRMNEGLVKSVRMSIDSGELAPDTDAEQVAFELFGIISSFFRSRNLFHDPKAVSYARKAYDRVIAAALAQPAH